ncbi:hypothetical protein OS493_036527 [Desmophyllum pertusum]|uniref:Prokineticin domain-containing protein n=1 Tax=Desmophyllum pertusum TaxID=174260 RepID=A0A9X0D0G3_9CNID|nr:hypothetical protein OS493_036527 [Desmophyllum pertusum]
MFKTTLHTQNPARFNYKAGAKKSGKKLLYIFRRSHFQRHVEQPERRNDTLQRANIRMKSILLWIGVFTILLTTCSAEKFVKKCRYQSDCSPKQCCAGVGSKSRGLCLPQPQLKDKCNPRIAPGAMTCPCRLGMTCSLRKGKGVYGCEYINPGPDEVDEESSLPQFS